MKVTTTPTSREFYKILVKVISFVSDDMKNSATVSLVRDALLHTKDYNVILCGEKSGWRAKEIKVADWQSAKALAKLWVEGQA